MKNEPYVSVIIVNYQIADLALRAVASVVEHDHGPWSVDVHLVDNASPSGDGARLKDEIARRGWSSRVTLYQETENHGFGRGNNVAIDAVMARDVPPRHILLLNPDAALRGRALEDMAAMLDATPRAAIVGARQVETDGTPICAAFRFPSVWSVIERAVNAGPMSRVLARHILALPPETSGMRVDWVSGGCMMVRAEAIAAHGAFDPDFFLYYEEVEWAHRLTKAGWQIWVAPEACVLHETGAATQVSLAPTERLRQAPYLYESWRLYFQKTHGTPATLAFFVLQALGMSINYPWAWALRKTPTMPKSYLRDSWRHVVRPCLQGTAAARIVYT